MTCDAIMGGTVYCREYGEWQICWESQGRYRHWCHQILNPKWNSVLVVMFNPGSLEGDGANLSRDTTLRILREVCGSAQLNPFIINLFDFADTSTDSLFDNWSQRDSEKLVFDVLPSGIEQVIYAYGDYESHPIHGPDITERVSLVKEQLSHLSEVKLPKNRSGSPKHPMVWQKQKLKTQVIDSLKGENMSTAPSGLDLLESFIHKIDEGSAMDAFHVLLGAATALDKFDSYPQQKGVISDYRFHTSDGRQPFAFIINKKSLLFYLRKPAIDSRLYELETLEQRFTDVNDNGRSEWTIKVHNRGDALRVVSEILNRWQ